MAAGGGRWLLPVVAMVAVLASACTAGKASSTPPEVAPGPVTGLPAPAARLDGFPLDQFMLRPGAANDIDTVLKERTQACMTRLGQKWSPGARNDVNLLSGSAFRFGVVDENMASSFGYHQENTLHAEPVDPRLARFLTGGPTGGCAGEASRAIGWRPAELAWLAQLSDQTLRQAYADPRAAAAAARWSRCMDEADLEYGRPQDAATDARWWRGKTAPSSAEKLTAVTDVRCKTKVRFVQDLGAVLTAEQTPVVKQNSARLDAFRRMAGAAAAKADVLRGDHEPSPKGSATAIPPGMWRTEQTKA